MSNYFLLKSKFSISLILFSSIYAFIYLTAIYIIYSGKSSDFLAHSNFAMEMEASKQIISPHFFYAILLIVIHKTFTVSYEAATYIVIFSSVFFTSLICMWFLMREGVTKKFCFLAPFFLLFANPIAILYFVTGSMYMSAYAYMNVYHNPTILLLKPIALLVFCLLTSLLSSPIEWKKKYQQICLLVFITMLSILAKPSFIIVLLPALVLTYFYYLFSIRVSVKNWIGIITLIVLSSVLILGWQFSMTYSDHVGSSTIGIGLFKLYLHVMEGWEILPSLLLSIFFQISILFFIKRDQLTIDYVLGFFLFLIGLVYACFFHEVGTRFSHGNFIWSLQIANFLWFFASLKNYLIACSNNKLDSGVIIASWCLLLSQLSGLIYYFRVVIYRLWY